MRYMTWNAADTEQLIELWRNHSESQIAAIMQRTRNAVAGKLNRIRAGGAALEHPTKCTGMRKPRVYKPRPPRVKPPPPPPKPRPVYEGRRWQLVELAHDQCRWPTGHVKSIEGMYFCGLCTVPDKPYCEAHCEVAFKEKQP